MKYTGICPASCGEFVQGIVKDEEYLSSYTIDMYSKAILEEKNKDIIKGPRKSRKAIEEVFKKFSIPIEESKNISLNIKSDIPIGKGMASSSADIGATIIATLNLLNKKLSSEEISKLACSIEPTDSIYIEKSSIFNPLNGEVVKYLGEVKDLKVIILEPSKTLDTMKIRNTPNYKEIKLRNREIISNAFTLLEQGIKTKDLNMIGEACTMSSLANENIDKKEGLKEVIKISQELGAYGVNVAHSGTVMGILIDNQMKESLLIDKLKEANLQKIYKKIYTHNIIKGGIRGE